MIVGSVLLVNVFNLTLEILLLTQHSLEILLNHSSEVLVHFACSSPMFMFSHLDLILAYGVFIVGLKFASFTYKFVSWSTR